MAHGRAEGAGLCQMLTTQHSLSSRHVRRGAWGANLHGVGTRLLLPRRCMSPFGLFGVVASATQRVHRHQHRPGGRGTPP